MHYPTFEDMCRTEAEAFCDLAFTSATAEQAVANTLFAAAELTNDRSLSTALIVLSKHVVAESDEVSDGDVVAVYDWVDEIRTHRDHMAQLALQEAS